ncbi:SDR family NAD(P)-dependent oxidoreductase [Fictibacillus fluitans]|uniref:SDR family NAD(P)-dependent oxidoreductase n=1 Tax=Fictibacillus fluitans TaxID=3058422 RepID=A0ABT8HVT8_9BACL|nr:SDR family NAD(P)-dependent oxidoreductase [Fictibacillus sp. NE201]MDN4524892.1 SDR family NAD(P)-dependent oxidoreductase [Fictibacillus sp. NE201]
MTDKVIVIAGAGPGISMAAAKKFGSEGYKVALIARRLEALKEYEKQLRNLGIEAKGFPGDVSSEISLKTAISAIADRYGKIDTLLYNAASGKPGKPTELTVEDLVRDFKISVAGALISVQEVLPYMENGSILLTGGGLALQPFADYASLAIGKAGIRNLAYSLSQELKETGIYVGTLTVKGFVQEGTPFSPDHIADTFYTMNQERSESEVAFEGK